MLAQLQASSRIVQISSFATLPDEIIIMILELLLVCCKEYAYVVSDKTGLQETVIVQEGCIHITKMCPGAYDEVVMRRSTSLYPRLHLSEPVCEVAIYTSKSVPCLNAFLVNKNIPNGPPRYSIVRTCFICNTCRWRSLNERPRGVQFEAHSIAFRTVLQLTCSR